MRLFIFIFKLLLFQLLHCSSSEAEHPPAPDPRRVGARRGAADAVASSGHRVHAEADTSAPRGNRDTA